jgi:hypothetical protein
MTGLSSGIVEKNDQHCAATGKCRNAKHCCVQNQIARMYTQTLADGPWDPSYRLGTSPVIFKAVYLGLQMRSQSGSGPQPRDYI